MNQRLRRFCLWRTTKGLFRPASIAKYFMLFGLVILPLGAPLPVTTAPRPAVDGTWKLDHIRVINSMDGSVATITSERYDATGGSVDIQISGNVLGGTCPGGFEKLRFTWQFEQNVSRVVNGGAVSANLDARQIGKSQKCGDEIAWRSYMSLYPSAGVRSPLPDDVTRQMDGERFHGPNGFRAAASQGTNNGIGNIRVNTHANRDQIPYAYFAITIFSPTASGGGILRYAYVFENRSNSGTTGVGGFTGEDNVDRPGGDYRNFDLAEANWTHCRQACADDRNCRSYAYVRPGLQGAAARCWLKNSVPAAVRSNCCISGVRQ